MEKSGILALLALFLLALFLASCSEQEEKITGGSSASFSTLTVVVKDESGFPLLDAKVYLNGEFQGKTNKYGDGKGTQTVLLDKAENTLIVRKEGYADSRQITVSAGPEGGEQSITIILERKKTTYVVSVVAEGRPVEDVRVTLFYFNTTVPLQQQLTDEQGAAYFEAVDDGVYMITIAREGYDLLRLKQEIDYDQGGEFASTMAELRPFASLLVQVDDESTSPVRNAEVSLFSRQAYHAPGTPLPLSVEYTDREGQVEFTSVEYEETYVLVVKKEGYRAEVVEQELSPEDKAVRVVLVEDLE